MARTSYSRHGEDDPYKGQSRKLLDALSSHVSFDPALMLVKRSLFGPVLRRGTAEALSRFLLIRSANLCPISRVNVFIPFDKHDLALSSV